MNKRLYSALGLVFIAVLLVAVNALANALFTSTRIDMTSSRFYTLADGTKNILKSLDETITLRFFFSEKLAVNSPSLMNYANRVRDLLEEFEANANGKIKLLVADPEPFSDEEDQAVQNRLQGVPIDSAGTLVYFGLVGSGATDEKEVIPFFQIDREQSLEYDVTRMIYNLSHPEKKPVGIISTLPIEGMPPNATMPMRPAGEWAVLNVMRQTFSLRFLGVDVDEVPEDIEVLMVVHPKALPAGTLYAIDQFALRGGRVLMFVDPFAEEDVMARQAGAPVDSNPAPLLDAWGVEMDSGSVAADIQAATRVTVSGGLQPQSVDYVAWMSLKPANFNKEDFVAGGLDQINMATPGFLKIKEGTGLTVTPLIETSDRAAVINTAQFQAPNPMELLKTYKSGDKRLTLAARISGKAKSAFAHGAPVKLESGAAHLAEAKGSINVIVVADVDMLGDRFWVDVRNFFGQRVAIPRANNGAFVVNALDNLSGSTDLIGLRSRGVFSRPFEKVKQLQREAEQRFLDKEKELRAKLDETERKIKELQTQKQAGNAVLLSGEQRQEMENFQAEQVRTRKELRGVQHELRKNIESLGAQLKFINITLVPIVVIVLALVLGWMRQRRVQA
jgi:ABC-type uncharacterized transport system involved in gliding motility auxiliary subunit